MRRSYDLALLVYAKDDVEWSIWNPVRFARDVDWPSFTSLRHSALNSRSWPTDGYPASDILNRRRQLAGALMTCGALSILSLQHHDAGPYLREADDALGDPRVAVGPNDLVWSAAIQVNLGLSRLPYSPQRDGSGEFDPDTARTHLLAATERISRVDVSDSELSIGSYECVRQAILELWPILDRESAETWWRQPPYAPE